MRYHTPIAGRRTTELPMFVTKNGELLMPHKIYSKSEYPNLPSDMVKITGRDGRRILVPIHKVKSMDH